MNIANHKVIVSAIVLNLILTFSAFGQTPVAADIRPLASGKTVEREIKAAQEHFYAIKLKAGEALRLELEEGQDANYVFRLINADSGETIIDADLTQTFGREEITYIAAAKVNLKVLVKAPEKAGDSAKYKLTATVTKRAMEADKERIKAEELSREAAKLSKESASLPIEKRTEGYQRTITLAEEALEIRRKQADKYWESWTVNFLANRYNQSGDDQKALDYYNQTIQAVKPNNIKTIQAISLFNTAQIYRRLNEPTKAIDNYNQALDIFRELKDQRREANTLFELGTVYHDLDQARAKDYYEQSLTIKRELKDKKGESITLLRLGLLYSGNSRAVQYFEKVLIIARETEDYRLEIDALYWIGNIYYPEEKSAEFYEQALNIARKIKDKEREYSLINRLAEVYGFFDANKAIQYYEQSLSISQELKNKGAEFDVLLNLAGKYSSLNKYEKALISYKHALSISQELKDNKKKIYALTHISELYLQLKNYEKVLDYDNQIVSVSQNYSSLLDDEEETIHILTSVYKRLKQYEKAINLNENYYKNFIAKSNAWLTPYNVLGNIADLHKEQKHYEKAKEFLEKQLAIFNFEDNLLSEMMKSQTLISLGDLYLEQKQYEKARGYFEQSLTIKQKSKSRKIPQAIRSLAGLYLELKQYDKAKNYLDQIIKGGEDSFGRIGTLSMMVELYIGLNNPELAIFYGKQLINEYQNVRSEIKSFDRDTQLSYLKDKEPAYRKLADLLISEGRFAEAETVLDLLKEEEFRNYTVRRSGENPDTVPYSRAELDVAAKVENLAKLERERSELLSQKEKAALPAEKQSRLDQLAAEIETANRAFRLSLDALAKADLSVESKVAEIKTEKNLQRALAQLEKETGSKTVALYTLLGTEASDNEDAKAKTKSGWIMLVTPTSRKAYPIDVADLEQTVFQFRETLQSDKYDPLPAAQKLYMKLFRQTSVKQKVTLEQDLETLFGKDKDKTLMWSLDGILRYVPMAALHDGKSFLVEKYRHTLFTKESFLTLTEKDKSKWQALGLGVSEGGKNYSPLPGAEKELKDIVRQPQTATGVIDGQIKLNKDFKEEETFRLWSEGSFPVVHIASHYAFNPTDPTSSFLLAGDGQMTFAEMQDKDNLFGAVDLLTLSACDTAMTANGKEAEGFAYLAQNLGAKSVIASLWKISDAGTPELMVRFYKLRAENPEMTKGEAFRQAQISLLAEQTKNTEPVKAARRDLIQEKGEKSDLPLFKKDEQKPFAHPHYWSSFVLIGNWR
jgi:CHAT domain-containing protein/tetratricopeptide (TPR) repeat protein